MWFWLQKKHIPTPRRLIRNSELVGYRKTNFKGKYDPNLKFIAWGMEGGGGVDKGWIGVRGGAN